MGLKKVQLASLIPVQGLEDRLGIRSAFIGLRGQSGGMMRVDQSHPLAFRRSGFTRVDYNFAMRTLLIS